MTTTGMVCVTLLALLGKLIISRDATIDNFYDYQLIQQWQFRMVL